MSDLQKYLDKGIIWIDYAYGNGSYVGAITNPRDYELGIEQVCFGWVGKDEAKINEYLAEFPTPDLW
jgi:hypothetical protein